MKYLYYIPFHGGWKKDLTIYQPGNDIAYYCTEHGNTPAASGDLKHYCGSRAVANLENFLVEPIV